MYIHNGIREFRKVIYQLWVLYNLLGVYIFILDSRDKLSTKFKHCFLRITWQWQLCKSDFI